MFSNRLDILFIRKYLIAVNRLNVMACFVGAWRVWKDHFVNKCYSCNKKRLETAASPYFRRIWMNHNKVSRRTFLSKALVYTSVGGLLTTSLTKFPLYCDAEVFFDIDRYGDKELTISTINRLKQTLRNTLSKNLDLLPQYIQLALHDALSYSKQTKKGGLNGSLRFEMQRPGNAFLSSCYQSIEEAHQSYSDVGYGDYIAFAGSVALDIVGAPRVKLQVGREDVSGPDDESQLSRSTQDVSYTYALEKDFQQAGLEATRNCVLFLGALGFLSEVCEQFSNSKQKGEEESSDTWDIFDQPEFTYGDITQKGKRTVAVGTQVRKLKLPGIKFSNQFLKKLVNQKNNKQTNSQSFTQDKYLVLLEEPRFLKYVEYYAKNNQKFRGDFVDAYHDISLLGSRYETLKQ
ncbi:Probable L-ascorbate peroxidase 3 [Galdieria sulphuraria]|uniref:Ascorbate peroxidase n=1 Tax=Galdieria sulphuraria TaxID=130081 RepID=M2X3F8_GALSU|nr:ascorbate peroxidase [Galdieria sulphuraria]EME30930.1 ascorbate peroxidase [Galdieria sulphuraria]GJD11844.1 Probable L-ascorbate peroxidase 3 [Galdieria sulphuraria]|eukprot:XP_005707450.1 ascorbate peroxidase [Galdieria sulphuraria]